MNLEPQIRGSGRTHRQMIEAPQRAVYIWCNSHLFYPRELAREIGRADLRIIGPADLEERLRGLKAHQVVFDHALELTTRQADFLRAARIL
jgi:hypothetical protein